MASDGTHVLFSTEAEAYVESLRLFTIEEIGNLKWVSQHEQLEKLNMQAILSASANEEEFVKEYLISHEKVPLLINQLLITELWKEKVFAALVDMEFVPKTTFQVYMVLYDEATIVNLLETVLFHQGAMEAAEDFVLDITDYCYRKLLWLVGKEQEEFTADQPTDLTTIHNADNLEELEKQNKTLEFDICLKAVSILRYIVDHMAHLPLSVASRVLNTHDVPVLMVQLIESPPWLRHKGGKIFKFVDSKWREMEREESMKLTKLEGQIWISLYQLLMDGENRQKYDLNQYRKNVVIKLRAYLTEGLLDQLPLLCDFLRFLEQLSMYEPPAPRKDFVLEQVPEMRSALLRAYEGKWRKVAEKQARETFDVSDQDMRAQAQRWAATYNMDVMSELMADPPKCGVCGEPATKRCSRCQTEWYCRRECQVQHWPKHKEICNAVCDAAAADKQ